MSGQGLDFIVPAGGSGQRAGRKTPKQFLPLAPDGRSVLEMTLERLLGFNGGANVVLVCREDWIDRLAGEALLNSLLDRLAAVVPGGPTRQASVHAGLEALSQLKSPNEWVGVHDAARPFVTEKTIRMTWEAAKGNGHGAIACGKLHDTLKRVGKTGSILRTEDRNDYLRAETPQIFRAELLRKASSNALRDGREATDESMLIEPMGYPIASVVSGDPNPKLTTLHDIQSARKALATK